MSAVTHLRKQLKSLTDKPVAGFSVEVDEADITKWTVWIAGPKETPYEGGHFRAVLEFPSDFPFMPPTMTFTSKMWHPNVYPDGKVCISILHPPGEDRWGYESAAERWSPIQSVESVLISVISMLSDPNDESPANLDAAIEWRKKPKEYHKRICELVAKAQAELPPGFVPPLGFEELRPQTSTGAKLAPVPSTLDDDEDMEDAEDDGVDPADKKKYAEQLKQLRDIGVGDSVALRVKVLKDCKGELDRAIEVLLS